MTYPLLRGRWWDDGGRLQGDKYKERFARLLRSVIRFEVRLGRGEIDGEVGMRDGRVFKGVAAAARGRYDWRCGYTGGGG